MRILGIHDGHNASAAWLEDGVISDVIQEERLVREKNHCGFPTEAVRRLLQTHSARLEDLDVIAFASHHTTQPGNLDKAYRKIALQQVMAAAHVGFYHTPLYLLYKRRTRAIRLANLRRLGSFAGEQVTFLDHHLCHAAAGYYGLTGGEGEYLSLSLDGSGDGLCATVGVASRGEIRRICATAKGASLGDVYSRTTLHLGFKPWEHEYKLMGMAPYCSPERSRQVARIFDRYLDLDPADPLVFRRKILRPTWGLYPRLRRDLEGVRFDWVCGGLQEFTERLLERWVASCVERTGIRRLLLSGGVFMNVKANGCLLAMPQVDEVLVMPSCGDESLSIGAAYLAYRERTGSNPRPFADLYLGPDLDDAEARRLLEGSSSLSFSEPEDLEAQTARLLAEGEVVARCSGRMEFGARALGNRSILCHPGRLEQVAMINKMVKKRDFWMPFAPVVPEANASRYLDNPKGATSPYMMLAFGTTDRDDDIRAALHPFDRSCRPQILPEGQNPPYQRIVEEFERLTGIGALLNTSFNLHGFPIVCTAQEGLEVFRDSGLQHLVLGPFLVEKPAAGSARTSKRTDVRSVAPAGVRTLSDR